MTKTEHHVNIHPKSVNAKERFCPPTWFVYHLKLKTRQVCLHGPQLLCLRKLLGIKWYHHVRNDEVRRTTGQPRLSAIVQAWRLSLFGHIARMPDETDARSIITASPSENWRRPPGRPWTTWMKTIQQDLRSNNLSLDEVIKKCGSESSTLETDACVWHCTPLVVPATQEEEEEDSCGTVYRLGCMNSNDRLLKMFLFTVSDTAMH